MHINLKLFVVVYNLEKQTATTKIDMFHMLLVLREDL